MENHTAATSGKKMKDKEKSLNQRENMVYLQWKDRQTDDVFPIGRQKTVG